VRTDTLPCPCGSTWTLKRPGKDGRSWDAACRREGGGRAILYKVAEHYRVYPRELIDGPEGTEGDDLPWNFDQPGRAPQRSSDGPPDPYLTPRQVERFAAALPHSLDAVRYLHGKGISVKAARAFRFGVGKPIAYRRWGLVTPIQTVGDAITFRLRALPIGEPKEVPPRGRPLAVWPDMPADDRPIVLVESPLKAAALRQRGFYAFGLCGASQYGLAHQLGWHASEVAVLWDVGVPDLAEKTVEAIRNAGTFAYSVDLGLPDKDDDPADWFTTYGKSAGELRRLIRTSRRLARKGVA
jgi:hypothetical protein